MRLAIVVIVCVIALISGSYWISLQDQYQDVLVGAWTPKDDGWVWIEAKFKIKRGNKVTLDIMDRVPGLKGKKILYPMAVIIKANGLELIKNSTNISFYTIDKFDKYEVELVPDGWAKTSSLEIYRDKALTLPGG